jgi:hypothetical protein
MGGGGIIETDNPPRNGNGSGTPREGEQTRRQRPVSGGNSLAWAGKRTSPIIGGTGMDPRARVCPRHGLNMSMRLSSRTGASL